MGHPEAPDHPAKLPNLHEFAREATNFRNAFTPVPLFTPARGCLFTGRLPHQNGTMDNVQGKTFYPHGKLHSEKMTYLGRLRDDGFRVAFIGKWHLADGTVSDRGIDDVILSDGGDTPLTAVADVTFGGPRKSPFYGTITKGEPRDGLRVKRAISSLPELAASDHPFCPIVSLHAPLFPHHVPAEYVALYDDLSEENVPDNWCAQFSETGKPVAQSSPWHAVHETSQMTSEDWRRTAQHYWGFCSYVDALFGRFRKAVTDAGLDNNSIFAFTADHGEMLRAHGWCDKGPFFCEEVLRIPTFIRDATAARAIEREASVSFRDLFPTEINRAGAGGLLEATEDSRDDWAPDADHVFYCYDAYQGRQLRFRGVRNARYKYAWRPHDFEELYDLETDPGERRNLAGNADLAQVKTELKARLFDWMRAENDRLSGPGFHPPVGS